MAHRILLVEDTPELLDDMLTILKNDGFDVVTAEDGESALKVFAESNPDLVLLDVNLPQVRGIDVLKGIRETSQVPVFMWTAAVSSEDLLLSYEYIADDYIPKTIRPDHLLDKIKGRLARIDAAKAETDRIEIGPLVLDIVGHQVRRGNDAISLTPIEFELLKVLAQEPAKCFTRADLLGKVWGYRYKDDARLVNVHVQRLRSKIEDDPDNPKIVLTIRGVGYKAGTSW